MFPQFMCDISHTYICIYETCGYVMASVLVRGMHGTYVTALDTESIVLVSRNKAR